jgi:DNA-binding TFAR19-related protein (PDSD5 family)
MYPFSLFLALYQFTLLQSQQQEASKQASKKKQPSNKQAAGTQEAMMEEIISTHAWQRLVACCLFAS